MTHRCALDFKDFEELDSWLERVDPVGPVCFRLAGRHYEVGREGDAFGSMQEGSTVVPSLFTVHQRSRWTMYIYVHRTGWFCEYCWCWACQSLRSRSWSHDYDR